MKHLKIFENHKISIGNSRYTIERICWSDNTYNGHEDNPYWLIKLVGRPDIFGLSDGGELWLVSGQTKPNDFIKIEIEKIINECKLNIKLI